MNATTIHDAAPSVRMKRAKNSRRLAIGLAISSRRSSARKKLESAVTTPLNARNARNDRNSHDSPSRNR
jgi:hypothetical protein